MEVFIKKYSKSLGRGLRDKSSRVCQPTKLLTKLLSLQSNLCSFAVADSESVSGIRI